jgi:hypothetical protein
VRGKIQDLCSRIAALEKIFGAPTDDVEEEKRRNGLSLYDISHHPDPSLISFQQAQGDRETIEVFVRKVKSAAVCRARSRRRRDFRIPRRSARGYRRLPGSFKILAPFSMLTRIADGATDCDLRARMQANSECSPFASKRMP